MRAHVLFIENCPNSKEKDGNIKRMPITFSDHAKKQLRRRKISQKLAFDIVKNPDKTIVSFRNRKLRQRLIGDKILEIVTVTEGSRITIITGYIIEKI